MRLSTIGIILLTAMVATKYIISLDELRAEDGSFKSGVSFDYTETIAKLTAEKSNQDANKLLAIHSSGLAEINLDKITDVLNAKKKSESENVELISGIQINTIASSVIEEPLPMEHGNSLVVYDFSNPDNNIIGSNFDDVEDDVPLDNGNTIINGFMQIMPRR